MSPNGDMRKTKFKTYDPDAPQNNLFAALVMQVNRGQKSFILLSILLILSIIGNTVQVTQHKLIPVIVTVDKTTGEVSNLGVLTNYNYTASDVQIQSMLSNFLTSVQSVSLDQSAYAAKIDRSKYFMTTTAANKLLDFIRNSQIPVLLKEKETSSVVINSVMKVSGTVNTWQANYTIQYYDTTGNPDGKSIMLGTFTVISQKPTTHDGIIANPLGLVITDLSITGQQTTTQNN